MFHSHMCQNIGGDQGLTFFLQELHACLYIDMKFMEVPKC